MATPCLVPAELMVQSLDDSTAIERPSRAALHLAECAQCRADVARVRNVVADLRAVATVDPAEGECLDELGLGAFVDNRLSGHQRASAVAHLAACGRCRRGLAGLYRLMTDDRVTVELTRVAPTSTSRRGYVWRIAGIGLAAALTLVLLRPRSPLGNQRADQLRDETVVAAPAPRTLTPAGLVSDASRLRWTTVAGSDLYRVMIFDAEGVVLWQSETGDTTAAVPAGVHLGRDVRLVWRVQARVGFDRWISSALTPFVIAGAGRSP